MEKNEIILFKNGNMELEVNLENETVWLSQGQIAELYDTERSVITKHLRNIFNSGELEKDSVCANFAHTANDGKTYSVAHYNLDAIISVGYRVNSKKATKFRIWSTKILKEHLLKGYTINQKRLEFLEKTVKLIDIASRSTERLDNNDAKEVIKVISNYTKALDLLDDYDHRTLKKVKGINSDEIITYDNCLSIIKELRFNEESDLFAIERNHGLESIINNIYQTFDNKDIYPSIEEKAANFLYMIVKNHVFIDGNKRIAATLFIYFLFFYNILYKEDRQVIDNNTLAALTLLIAESNPKEKEVIIDLVMNFLV